MNKENLYSIGEVARLFHLSVSSLRHYEKINLIKPEFISPDSGYRYYSTRQFEILNTIRYLRALDMPLGEISDFLGDRDVERIKEKLEKQKRVVLEKRNELDKIEHKIKNRLKMLNDAQDFEFEKIFLVKKDKMRMSWINKPLEIHSFLDMEQPMRDFEKKFTEPVVFLGKVGVGISPKNLCENNFKTYDGMFLILDDEDAFDGETVCVPSEICVCIRFHGSHSEAKEYYKKLMSYINENHLEISGFSREITMIDYGITNDPEKFVTEISIPVLNVNAP